MNEPCLVYKRHYNRPLQWHIVRDPYDPSKAPDVVFDDVTFVPLLDPSHQEELAQLLDGWESHGSTALAALLELLVALYMQHQKDKIAALGDERMLFELAMLEDLGCSEVQLAAAPDGTQQACFSIPVSVDLAPAQRLINFLQPSNSSSDTTRNQQRQQQQQGWDCQLQQQQQQFMLHVAFRVGRGVNSHTAPELQLQLPLWAAQQLPPLPLPGWDPQSSLVEYVPHLAERLAKHLQDHCPAAALRFELVSALAGVLGTPLEVNMRSSAIKVATASGSSSSGGLAAAAAAKGRSSSSALFQVLFDQQTLLLFVEMPATFPAEAPLLMMQSLRRSGADSSVALQGLPWSPRWDADEMAARLFNFVKQQAPHAVRQLAAAAGGTAGSSL